MKKRIRKKAAKPVKRKAGRPAGSKSKLTSAERDALDNRLIARWGERGGSLGGAVAHQEWIDRHPSAFLCELRAKARNEDPEAYRARFTEEKRAEPLNPLTQGAIKDAIYARDWRFFMDMADCLRRLNADGSVTPNDPREIALLDYVDGENYKNFERCRVAGRESKPLVFSVGELLDRVPWGRDESGPRTPSERDLRRMCDRLKIPRRQGRPPKK